MHELDLHTPRLELDSVDGETRFIFFFPLRASKMPFIFSTSCWKKKTVSLLNQVKTKLYMFYKHLFKTLTDGHKRKCSVCDCFTLNRVFFLSVFSSSDLNTELIPTIWTTALAFLTIPWGFSFVCGYRGLQRGTAYHQGC